MIYTKRMISDRVVDRLQNDYPNIDFKIQPRDIFLVVDDVINRLAKQNYLENFKFFGGVDEGFITTWSGDSALTVIDPTGGPSYFTLPAIPVALPNNEGIREVWPLNYKYGAVKLRKHEDVRRTRNLMSGNMQGELGGYPQYPLFVFDQMEVSKKYSTKFGLRMVVKDSKDISETAPFPVSSDVLQQVIDETYRYFQEKRLSPTDTVRDRNDKV